MIVAGEVHTGLLQHSHALSPAKVATLLSLAPGEPVRQAARPIAYGVSPELLSGIDCLLPGDGKDVRIVGTCRLRALVVGGHVLQGSTFAVIEAGESTARLPWSYYLARPGRVHSLSGSVPDDLSDRLAAGPRQTGQLDMGAMSGRTMDLVHRHASLDRRPPFKAVRTRLRWTADTLADSDDTLALTIGNDRLRTLRVPATGRSIESIVQQCEDIAYHDWLLTTMLTIVERAGIGAGRRNQTMERLIPAVDHLLHLWMPGAHGDSAARRHWRWFEDRPGFTKQWTTLVNRVRDQITTATMSSEVSSQPQRL